MPSTYWIKLYIEILNDRKVAKLSTHLRWRMVECFLLAGDMQKDGDLPSIDDAAWLLRVNPKDLEKDWSELEQAGILKTIAAGWKVAKFAKRQAALSSTERWQEWQKRQAHKQYSNDHQTNDKRIVGNTLEPNIQGYDGDHPPDMVVKRSSNDSLVESDIDIDIDTESEEEEEAPADSDSNFNTFEANPIKILCDASSLSDFPADQREWVNVIQSLVDDHGVEKTTDAMKRACSAWIKTKSKNGRPYRKTNLNWINWAQEVLAGGELPSQSKKVLTLKERQEIEMKEILTNTMRLGDENPLP